VRHVMALMSIVVTAAAVLLLTGGRGSTDAASDPSPGALTCAAPTPGTHLISVDPDRIPVVLHVPPGPPPASGRRPLILVLPGSGETARDIATYTGYSRLADRQGFLVAYPTATGARPSWNISGTQPGKPDDLAYLRRVITALTGPAGCGDPSRVGVTGVSNGGGMAARLACDAADLLSAAAPVAGGYSSLPSCDPQRPLPILEIHSIIDAVVPYRGKGESHAGDVGRYLQEWRERDGCTTAPARSTPADDVTELRWRCAGGRVVVHDRVTDAEHGWPGEDSLEAFSSTLRTWRFLTSFGTPSPVTRAAG
jgi:polyhydroxybutyrate depolymerase